MYCIPYGLLKREDEPKGGGVCSFLRCYRDFDEIWRRRRKNWIEPTRLRPADPSGQDLFFIIFSSSCYFDLEVKKIKKKWNNIMEIPLGIDFLLKKDV